jgi:hypothetical protein
MHWKGSHVIQIPSYFLAQPEADWGEDTLTSFERLFDQALENPGAVIHYRLPAPKWQFLCHLCEQKEIVLHGSGETEIAELDPRQSNDATEFGNRRAIYAASDGIWAMYFAIIDRRRVTSLNNSCYRVIEPSGRSGPYYFFSVNGDALPYNPWRRGMIYVLPRHSFEPQPLQEYRGAVVEIAQWASHVPVKPLAKLAVGPEDFPFLGQIRPHDPAVVRARAVADPEGFPWLDEEEVLPSAHSQGPEGRIAAAPKGEGAASPCGVPRDGSDAG